jgi:hypothetical protein
MKDLCITLAIIVPTVTVAFLLKDSPFGHGASIGVGVCIAYYIGQAVGK